MSRSTIHRTLFAHRLILAAVWLSGAGPAWGQGAREGDQAKLFASVDENLQPVDMADLIDGRPLVLLTGSAS